MYSSMHEVWLFHQTISLFDLWFHSLSYWKCTVSAKVITHTYHVAEKMHAYVTTMLRYSKIKVDQVHKRLIHLIRPK